MRNFTAVYADLTPEEVAEIMENPKCRFASHADLATERAAGQAREAKLRDALSSIVEVTCIEHQDGCATIIAADIPPSAKAALAIPADDTALKDAIRQAKREALIEAADSFDTGFRFSEASWVRDELRRMAGELK
jgi:hypothetical protein